jgi:hypothetical protein
MSFSVGLYRDFARKGGITFRTVPATRSSDYVSEGSCRRSQSPPPEQPAYRGDGSSWSVAGGLCRNNQA